MIKKLLIGIAIGIGAMAGAHAQDYSTFMGVDVNGAVADSSAAAAYYDQTGVVTTGINDISLIGQGQQQAADLSSAADDIQAAYDEIEPLVHVALEDLGEILDAAGEILDSAQELIQELGPLVDQPDQPDPNIAAEC